MLILKGIVVICITIFLFAISQAETLEDMKKKLDGGEMVQQGHCLYNVHVVECAVYKKDNVKYLLYRDANGVFAIYRVKEGREIPYGPDDTTILWERKQGTGV